MAGLIITILVMAFLGYLVSLAMGDSYNKQVYNENYIKDKHNNVNLNTEEYTPEEQKHLDSVRKQLEDEAKEREDASSLALIKEQQLQQEKIDAQNEQRKLTIKQQEQNEVELKERTAYINSISTSNPVKWAKYTLIINKAEKKFVDIYNFQTPAQYKKVNLIMPLSATVLFEEARLERLSPKDFIELLVGLGGEGLAQYIKPVGNDLFDFEAYRRMYIMYIDFRARELRPIVAMMASLNSIDGSISETEIEEFSKEYETNPMFGRSV